ncbi:DUF4369 domain-containing protein [Urechidicola sp. KH5]
MIKKFLFAIGICAVVVACSPEKKGAMVVEGTIKGLKKGTVYLQKFQDTTMVVVDSIFVSGKENYRLAYDLKEPQLFFLSIDKNGQQQIEFFGEASTIKVNTRLDKFVTKATIEGSSHQDLLDEYKEMIDQFSEKRLDLIKQSFDARTADNDSLAAVLDKRSESLVKNRYRYTASFAIKNGDNEVAPYLALTELYDAHISLLDTVNNSLSERIKQSKYGVQLENFVKDIREAEKE